MADTKIVDLYWSSSEQAFKEAEAKYGKYSWKTSCNILADTSDAKGKVNNINIHL